MHSAFSSIFSKTIHTIAAINDKSVELNTEINVSSVTCFSILLLFIFPTRIAAKPNRTVNTNAKTVVRTLAKVFVILYPNEKTNSPEMTIGKTIKQQKSQAENLSVLAFLKTEN